MRDQALEHRHAAAAAGRGHVAAHDAVRDDRTVDMHREAAAKPPRVVLEKAVRHEARPVHLQTAARTVSAGRGQRSLPEGRPPDGAPAYGGVAAVSGEPLRDDAVRDKPARHRQRPSQLGPVLVQPAVGDRQALQNRLGVE